MTKINDFITAVVSKVNTELTDQIEECKPLAGLLETTDISAIHSKTPAVFISVVGSGESTLLETSEVDAKMLVVAYILVVKSNSIEREQITNSIVSRLLGCVAGDRWGLDYAYPAMSVESCDMHGLAKGFKPDVSSWRYGVSVLSRAADLYGGSDPISNMAIWAVTWEQTLRLGEDIYANNDKPPQQISAHHDNKTERLV